MRISMDAVKLLEIAPYQAIPSCFEITLNPDINA